MDYSRKQFFKIFPLALKNKSITSEAKTKKPRLFIRPPGASKEENEFLSLCDKCHKCIDACEFDAIIALDVTRGINEGTPTIDAKTKACQWCKDMPCIEACPTGALKMESFESLEPIAKAEINFDLCATSHGILCDYCHHACPSYISAISMINRKPQIDLSKCTGCGLCQYYCDAEPNAIIISKISDTW